MPVGTPIPGAVFARMDEVKLALILVCLPVRRDGRLSRSSRVRKESASEVGIEASYHYPSPQDLGEGLRRANFQGQISTSSIILRTHPVSS